MAKMKMMIAGGGGSRRKKKKKSLAEKIKHLRETATGARPRPPGPKLPSERKAIERMREAARDTQITKKRKREMLEEIRRMERKNRSKT